MGQEKRNSESVSDENCVADAFEDTEDLYAYISIGNYRLDWKIFQLKSRRQRCLLSRDVGDIATTTFIIDRTNIRVPCEMSRPSHG
jgi:hypothetical protein